LIAGDDITAAPKLVALGTAQRFGRRSISLYGLGGPAGVPSRPGAKRKGSVDPDQWSFCLPGPREVEVSSRVRPDTVGQPDYWVLAFARSLIFEAKSITWNV
jgi:hypothetical protein